jgi:hypothetical protein
MRQLLISPAMVWGLVAGFALPLAAQSAEPPPCAQIIAACRSAGFVAGDYRQGYGLWADCINPIMHGVQQPPRADKPLPSVSPELVAACRQIKPTFGEGHRGPPRGGAQPPPPPPPPPQ